MSVEIKYQIIDHVWRSALHTVGFVAYMTGNPANPGEWNSVVGYVPDFPGRLLPVDDEENVIATANGGYSESADVQYIAAHGAKIEWEIAQILFPNLNITKHKYYPFAYEKES